MYKRQAYETAAKELNDKLMPIGAKMYENASKEEQAATDAESKPDEKTDKDEPVEGEVVDEEKKEEKK